MCLLQVGACSVNEYALRQAARYGEQTFKLECLQLKRDLKNLRRAYLQFKDQFREGHRDDLKKIVDAFWDGYYRENNAS